MEILLETDTHEVFLAEWRDTVVRMARDKETGHISILALDFANYLGFETVEDMMLDDDIMDACMLAHVKTGEFPLKSVHL